MSEIEISKRVCPHCNGSLDRYEDPVAVKLLNARDAELASLRRDKERLAELCSKWRASANGHIRRGNGYRPDLNDLAAKAHGQAQALRECADELDAAMSENKGGKK